MKRIFSFMAIAICAMFFAPSVANAAEPTVMSEQAAPKVQAAQAQSDVIIIITDGTIIIIR